MTDDFQPGADFRRRVDQRARQLRRRRRLVAVTASSAAIVLAVVLPLAWFPEVRSTTVKTITPGSTARRRRRRLRPPSLHDRSQEQLSPARRPPQPPPPGPLSPPRRPPQAPLLGALSLPRRPPLSARKALGRREVAVPQVSSRSGLDSKWPRLEPTTSHWYSQTADRRHAYSRDIQGCPSSTQAAIRSPHLQ